MNAGVEPGIHRFKEWREALHLAPDTNTVYGIVRDCARVIRPVFAIFPEDCRRALADGADIQTAAVTLLQAELRFDGSDSQRALLHEVAHTFASAAVRITMLHPRTGSVPAVMRARLPGAEG